MVKIYKVFLCLLLACSLYKGNAQVLLSESFDGTTFPPTGWTNLLVSTGVPGSGDIDGDKWTRETSGTAPAASPHSGAGMAKYSSYDYNKGSQSALITKPINLSTGLYQVKFWIYRSGTYTNLDSLSVLVSTSNSISAISSATRIGSVSRYINASPAVGTVGWYQYSYDIPASFKGASNYVIFLATGNYGFNIFLDDISIEPQPAVMPPCVSNILPANGSTNVTYDPELTFTWTSSPEAKSYDFHYRASGWTADSIINTTDTSITLNGYFDDLLGNTAYSWFVAPKNSAGSNIACAATKTTTFTTAAPKSSVPSCVINVSPANHATNVPLAFTLKWRKNTFATQYLLYAGTSALDADVFDLVTDTTVSYVFNSGAFGTDFYWYVYPLNAVGEPLENCEISYATTFTFTTSPTTAPACATLVSPADNATGVSTTPATLSWNAVPGATGYRVYFGTNTTPSGVGNVSGTGATINLTANTKYYWYVRPYNSIDSAAGCIANIRSFTTGNPLPVSLTSFIGKRLSSNNVALEWSTATEFNNKGFDVQRSVDGINYSNIGFVASKSSNSSITLNYEFVDAAPLSRTGYYRLQQVDKDGKTSLSNIVVIDGIISTQLQVASLYPNPATSELNVIITSPDNDNVTLVITDITGKTITTKAIKAIAGNNKATINVNSLAKGSYLIKALCTKGCNSAIKKFVKD